MIDAVEMSQCLAACFREPFRFNKLRIIEFGVWQPHAVDLEKVLSKPLEHFIGDKVPDRKEYLDPVLVVHVRASDPIGPGGRNGDKRTFMRSPPPPPPPRLAPPPRLPTPPRQAALPRPPPPIHVDEEKDALEALGNVNWIGRLGGTYSVA